MKKKREEDREVENPKGNEGNLGGEQMFLTCLVAGESLSGVRKKGTQSKKGGEACGRDLQT